MTNQTAIHPLKSPGRVYFDHNATTPLAQEVAENLSEWAHDWGNPSSTHISGRRPKTLMRDARASIARFLNVNPVEVVFTSGGTEANNMLMNIFAERQNGAVSSSDSRARNEIIISAVEHPSLKNAAHRLSSHGFTIHEIPVSRDGHIDMGFLKKRLSASTALVSVMMANNETGHIFPIAEIARLAHEAGALVHTDAVQAFGKIPVNLADLVVDYASFSGHKFYALRGVGGLFVRRGSAFAPLLYGGSQERFRRGGTENVLAIRSLGFVCDKGAGAIEHESLRLASIRDKFEESIVERVGGVSITGGSAPRLPNSSSLVIEGIDGETLMMNLDLEGFSVSTGAACSSGSSEPSPVLLAMGLSHIEAQSSLRVGFGWGTTEEEVEQFLLTLSHTVKRLRKLRITYSREAHG